MSRAPQLSPRPRSSTLLRLTCSARRGGTTNPPANTLDGDRATFWRDDARRGGRPSFSPTGFESPHRIERIAFVDDVQNRYALGALEIQISQNSTDGTDGDWTTVDTVPSTFQASGGRVRANRCNHFHALGASAVDGGSSRQRRQARSRFRNWSFMARAWRAHRKASRTCTDSAPMWSSRHRAASNGRLTRRCR